jgi:asparagine synthase (glutamine-hydrolysing)
MPGLAGFTQAGSRPEESLRALKRMRELLAHGESRRSDELFCDGEVCATRSHTGILQPQPQPFEKAGVRAWLEGEFYNREELEALLDVSARRGTQPTDPSLLLALYARAGGDFDFLRRVDGIYAAVVYDANAGLLHLISDRYGLRHLFWTERGGGLAWASETKALLALQGFAPAVDRASVEDFFGVGHLTGERTWLEGVELLPAGTVLTWDLRRGALAGRRRYWSWDDIKPLGEVADERELAEELGRLFKKAVERRAAPGGPRVGLTLSGGLDSRAILAAVPGDARPLHAVTFGREGCDDIRIAASAAALKGAEHHALKLDATGWLAPRLEGVWWTDGHLNLMHMHAVSAAPLARQLFEVNLDGFLGDATIGGSYLDAHDAGERWNLENRGRRFISQGPAVLRPFVETRLPFFDNEFLGLALAAPPALRRGSRLYHMMLLMTFPEFFESIPWQSTGEPISWPSSEPKPRNRLGEKKERLLEVLTYFGVYRHPTRSYTDYANWIRREPARSFFESALRARGALYAEYVPRERFEAVLASHLRGRDRSEELGRFLTFEVWLRQVFEGEFRTAQEALPLLVEAG